VKLSTQQQIEIALKIAEGMEYLHSFNPIVVHRDLKSHNILVLKHKHKHKYKNYDFVRLIVLGLDIFSLNGSVLVKLNDGIPKISDFGLSETKGAISKLYDHQSRLFNWAAPG
jgi:serine/threonine protein kinase